MNKNKFKEDLVFVEPQCADRCEELEGKNKEFQIY